MKQKNQDESQNIADLLKKLQASYGTNGNVKTKKETKSMDSDDSELNRKLSSVLEKISSPRSQKSQKGRAKKAKEEEAPAKVSALTEDAKEDVSLLSPQSVADTPSVPSKKEKKAPSSKQSIKRKAAVDTAKSKPAVKAEKAKALPQQEAVPAAALEETADIQPTDVQPTDVQPTDTPTDRVPTARQADIPAQAEPLATDNLNPNAPQLEATEPDSEKEAEAVPPKKQSHPLEKVIPISVPAEESEKSDCTVALEKEESERAEPVREVPKASDEPVKPTKEETVEKQVPVKKESEPTADKPSAEKADASVKHITIASPASFSGEQNKQPDDAIVIRPPAAKKAKMETIVIRPRPLLPKQERPQILRADTSTAPIKIGKETASATAEKAKALPADAPKPTMQQNSPIQNEQVTTEAKTVRRPASVGTASKPPVKPDAKPTKKAGVSLPRVTAKAAEPVPEKKEKKKKTQQQINKIPIKTLPEDELFDEVLDEAMPESDAIEEIPADEPEEILPPPKKLSFFQRRQQQKERLAEQKLSAMELICKRSGLSEDDIVMMFELGYESELGRLVGYENLKRLKIERLKRTSGNASEQYRTAFGYRGTEFVGGHSQATLSAYVHDRRPLLLRLFLTALLSLLLLFADMPGIIGIRWTALPFDGRRFMQVIATLLFSFNILLSNRQIRAGAYALFRFSPTPYSIAAVLTPITLGYNILSCFLPEPMMPVSFLMSTVFFIMALGDVLRFSCEMRTLKLLCSEGEKTVLEPAVPRKKKLRQGEKIVKIINDDLGENMYQIRKCEQPIGFFRRFNNMDSAAKPITVLLAVSLSLATLCGLVNAVRFSDVASALSVFITVLAVSLPVSAFFTFFYPLNRANRLLSYHDIALIGEESVVEYQAKKTIIFQDTDLFALQKCTEIAVREGDDFRNDLKLAAALFRKLGGTLAGVGQAVAQTKEEIPVSIVRIQNNGVEAIADNQRHLLVGGADFLRRYGVRVPKESTDKALQRTQSISLTYVAIDGILKLSYEMEYHTKEAFEQIINDLAENGTSVAIHTYDPNLNEAFLQRSRDAEAEFVQVVKPGRFEENKPSDIVDTGIIALGDASDVVPALHAASAVSAVRSFGFRIQLIASILGSAAVCLLTFLGKSAWIGIPTVAVYQLFWTLVSVFASQSELTAEKLHLRQRPRHRPASDKTE